MRTLVEACVAAADRIGRRAAGQWGWRLVMFVCGAGTQLWISSRHPLVLADALAWAAIAGAVVLPRSPLPLVAAAMQVLLTAWAQPSVFEALPIALGLLGWHVAAAAVGTGRPWARRDPAGPSPTRALRVPLGIALLAIVAGVILAALATPGMWQPNLVATGLVAILLALGAALVLWPAGPSPRK
jgi:hypothetical protein